MWKVKLTSRCNCRSPKARKICRKASRTPLTTGESSNVSSLTLCQPQNIWNIQHSVQCAARFFGRLEAYLILYLMAGLTYNWHIFGRVPKWAPKTRCPSRLWMDFLPKRWNHLETFLWPASHRLRPSSFDGSSGLSSQDWLNQRTNQSNETYLKVARLECIQ